ncbi:MAG: hypothetical protein AVDCRST_MAG68-2230, partial [uncultured Gemmatimonadetes bacterium]
ELRLCAFLFLRRITARSRGRIRLLFHPAAMYRRFYETFDAHPARRRVGRGRARRSRRVGVPDGGLGTHSLL